MEIKHITQAIFNLAPEAEFAFVGDDLSTLEWHKNEVKKPSNSEILLEAEKLSHLPEIEFSIEKKLSLVGLSIDDLKVALGL